MIKTQLGPFGTNSTEVLCFVAQIWDPKPGFGAGPGPGPPKSARFGENQKYAQRNSTHFKKKNTYGLIWSHTGPVMAKQVFGQNPKTRYIFIAKPGTYLL